MAARASGRHILSGILSHGATVVQKVFHVSGRNMQIYPFSLKYTKVYPFAVLALFMSFSLTAEAVSAKEVDYAKEQQSMVKAIETDVVATSKRIGRQSLNPRVMKAMGTLPRHEFVPDDLKENAYENRPLPIGYGQTISQPYIVALMTDLADIKEGNSVLEVGTGSGYQAAILAKCGAKVYSIEIIKELGESARQTLQRVGFSNVEVRIGDGYYGWQEHAPFDAILVTAAASHVPPPLVEQLKPGGRMIIPVGGPFMTQYLMLVEKTEDGKVKTRQVLPVLFVPLTGGP